MNISNEDLEKIMEPIENYLWENWPAEKGKINREEMEEWNKICINIENYIKQQIKII